MAIWDQPVEKTATFIVYKNYRNKIYRYKNNYIFINLFHINK